MDRPWLYFENPILNATDNSYQMAIRISTWHDGALQKDNTIPFINTLYLAYHPIHLALATAYQAFLSQGGMQESETLNLRQLLRLLSNTKIVAWDIAIQAVYPRGSVRYKALLPDFRVPYQTGKQDTRIAAVKALSDTIGTDASLAGVKADVDAFYTTLNDANTSQKGSRGHTNTLSDSVEKARINMCVAQYSDLGKLIGEYAADTSGIDQYFDLRAIRHGQQVFFRGHAVINKTHTIVKHKFALTDSIKLSNPGLTELQFYLANTKGALPGGMGTRPIIVAAGTEVTVPVSSLGDIAANHYLMVFNPDLINKGEFVVEFL